MKNTRRRLLALLLCVLMATSVVMTACTPSEAPSTEATPPSSSSVTPQPSEGPGAHATLTFVLTTNTGLPVAGAKLILTNKYPLVDDEEYVPEVAVTNAEGVAVIELNDVDPKYPTTPYSLLIEDLPEFHLTGVQPDYEVAPNEDRVINITVIDNTPDGTKEHAYFVGADSVTKPFEAGQDIWFQAFGGEGRKVIIRGANVELTMLDQSYLPDENGLIVAYIVGVEADDHVLFQVKNTAGESREIAIAVEADPGTSDNPFPIVPGSQTVTAAVVGNRATYYRWVATEDGSVTAGPMDVNAGIVSIVRYRTEKDESGNDVTVPSASASTSAEGPSRVTMDYKAGDVIIVRVVTSDNSAGEVEFVFDYTPDEPC